MFSNFVLNQEFDIHTFKDHNSMVFCVSNILKIYDRGLTLYSTKIIVIFWTLSVSQIFSSFSIFSKFSVYENDILYHIFMGNRQSTKKSFWKCTKVSGNVFHTPSNVVSSKMSSINPFKDDWSFWSKSFNFRHSFELPL